MKTNRLDQTFAALAATHRKALVGYLTAGDPDLATSLKILIAACRAGLDVLELGVPFSDPTSDGPAIQAAAQRALRRGTSVRAVLELVRGVRQAVDTPIVLFSYFNPLLHYGLPALCAEAAAAGADGLLVVDLPPEESGELHDEAARHGLPLIRLVAPTTTPERMRQVVTGAGGFIYLITRTGVTGEGGIDPVGIAPHAAALRRLTPLPVCLGFGIRTAADVRALAPSADGLVVGSALVRIVADNQQAPDLPDLVAAKVRELRAGLAP